MAIKFEKIEVGMTLYDVRRNTGFGGYKWNVWPVYIKEVNKEDRYVIASWNGNAEEKMREARVCKYRAKRPSND
jgi:hypothetical protein